MNLVAILLYCNPLVQEKQIKYNLMEMSKKNSNPVIDWLGQNAMTLIILIGGFIAAWVLLGARVDAIEAKMALYPSEDFFDLKFETIDEKLLEINTELRTINGRKEK